MSLNNNYNSQNWIGLGSHKNPFYSGTSQTNQLTHYSVNHNKEIASASYPEKFSDFNPDLNLREGNKVKNFSTKI